MGLRLLTFILAFGFSLQSHAVWNGDSTKAYPSTVGISIRINCTAVVIAPKWLLTAGHCVEGATGVREILVRKGNGREVNTTVSKIYLHPGYHSNFLKNPSAAGVPYDLALVHLQRSIGLPAATLVTDQTQVKNLLKDGKATVVGYGHSGKPGIKKRKAVLPANYTDMYIETNTNSQSQSFCPGDSGGGLYVESEGKLLVIGVNSILGQIAGTPTPANLCGSPYSLGIAAMVAREADWIRQVSGLRF